MACRARGGYDYTFTKPPPQHLECPVCLLVLKEPQVSSCCGNHFCRACIRRVLDDAKPCPLCQDTDFNVMLHKGIMREVNALQVKCPNEEPGCVWKGELGKVGSHVEGECGHVEVECVYQCGRRFQRRHLREHEEEACPSRPVEVKMSCSLRKLSGDNEHLKMEVSKLKEKLNAVVLENKSLKGRVVKLENEESLSRQEIKSLKSKVKELQVAHTNDSSRDLQTLKQDVERLQQEQRTMNIALMKKSFDTRQLPPKPIDPLNVVMIENLKEKGILKTERVEETMKAIDRKHYAPVNHYVESPQSIGYSTSISAPHMHAHTLELLKDILKDGATALDVGSGSGYLTACMAYMSYPSGYAVGIDRVQQLTVKASQNIKSDNPELLRYNIFMVTGDGHEGYSPKAPYDAIHVGGATPTVPLALYDQLKCGWRMIIPVGPQGGTQYLEQHDKKMDGTITIKRLMGVRYGPLVKCVQ